MTVTDDGLAARRPRDRHRATGVRAELVGRAGDAAHAVRRASTTPSRHARRSAPRLGRRGALPDRPARQRRADGPASTPSSGRRRSCPTRRCSTACTRTGSAWSRSLFGGERKQVLEDIPITSRELGGIVGNPQATSPTYGLQRGVRQQSTGCTRCCPTACGWSASTARRTGVGAVPAHPPRGVAGAARRARLRGDRPHAGRAVGVRAGQQQLPGLAAHDHRAGRTDRRPRRDRPLPRPRARRAVVQPAAPRARPQAASRSFDDLTDDADVRGRAPRGLRHGRRRARPRRRHGPAGRHAVARGTARPASASARPCSRSSSSTRRSRLLGDRFYTDRLPRGDLHARGARVGRRDHLQGRAAAPLPRPRRGPAWPTSTTRSSPGTSAPWHRDRHPLRAWDDKREDPWAGDAPHLR